jgi:adenosylcobinamide-GDP ribazoletransferase
VDALCSRREKEEKLRILKDPHLSALCSDLYRGGCNPAILAPGIQVLMLPALFISGFNIPFLLSRSLTGLALVAFPCASQNGLAAVFAGNTRKKPVRIILGLFSLICLLAAFRLDIWAGMPAAIWAVLSFYWFHRVSKKNFGGLTGDLAGFYIVVYETGMIVLAAILGGIRS